MYIRQLVASCATLLVTVTIASAYTHPVYFYNYLDRPVTINVDKHNLSTLKYNDITVAPFSVGSNDIYNDDSGSYTSFDISNILPQQNIGTAGISVQQSGSHYVGGYDSASYYMEFKGVNGTYWDPLAYFAGKRAASNGWSEGYRSTNTDWQDFEVYISNDPDHYNWPNCPSVTGLNNPEDEQYNQLDAAGRWNTNYACYFKGDAKGDQSQYNADYIGLDPATEKLNPSSGNLDPATATNALYRITFLGGSYWMGSYANTYLTYSIDGIDHTVYPNNGYTNYRWAGNAPLTKQLNVNMSGISYNMGDSDGFAKIFYTPNTFSWVISIPKSEDHIDIGLHNRNFNANTYLSDLVNGSYDENKMTIDDEIKTHVNLSKPSNANTNELAVNAISFDQASYTSYTNGIAALPIGVQLQDVNGNKIDPIKNPELYQHVVFYYKVVNGIPADLVDNDLTSNSTGRTNYAVLSKTDMTHRISYFYSGDNSDPIHKIADNLTQYLQQPLYYSPQTVFPVADYQTFYLYSYNPVYKLSSVSGSENLIACYVPTDNSPICTTNNNASVNFKTLSFSFANLSNPFKCDNAYECADVAANDSNGTANTAVSNTPAYAFNGKTMSAVIDTQYNPSGESISPLFVDGLNYNPNIFTHHDLPVFIKVVQSDAATYRDQLLSGNYDKTHNTHASYNRTIYAYAEPVDEKTGVEIGFLADGLGYNNRLSS